MFSCNCESDKLIRSLPPRVCVCVYYMTVFAPKLQIFLLSICMAYLYNFFFTMYCFGSIYVRVYDINFYKEFDLKPVQLPNTALTCQNEFKSCVLDSHARFTLLLGGIYIFFYMIAERLSARQLIVQCGLKSQLAYIYIYICAQLPSRLGMELNLRLRSLYV